MMADVHEGPGKGFGGGEATRDPAPTQIDPNDPKGKQQAIHKAESFADYLKRRDAESRAGVPKMSGSEEMEEEIGDWRLVALQSAVAVAGLVASRGGAPSMMADVHEGPGKGFGGGEATRDPAPTQID